MDALDYFFLTLSAVFDVWVLWSLRRHSRGIENCWTAIEATNLHRIDALRKDLSDLSSQTGCYAANHNALVDELEKKGVLHESDQG